MMPDAPFSQCQNPVSALDSREADHETEQLA